MIRCAIKLSDPTTSEANNHLSKIETASLYVMTDGSTDLYSQKNTQAQVSNIASNIPWDLLELLKTRVIYDIRNPKLNHDFESMKSDFANTLSVMYKQLRRYTSNLAQKLDKRMYFSSQSDVYQLFQDIFKPKLFKTTTFRQICMLLWQVLREHHEHDDLDFIQKEQLYVYWQLYWTGKAILPNWIDVSKVTQYDYFPIHQAVFENRLHYIQKLLTNQV